MKAGDRVVLNEPLPELEKGNSGTVVVAIEQFPYTPPGVEEQRVLGVRFDHEQKYVHVSRDINGKRVSVISKCSLI